VTTYHDRLVSTRLALLDLHKLLLTRERRAYEREHGPVGAGTLLELAIGDRRFEWLHRISEIVVRIDQMLEWRDLWTDADAEWVLSGIRALLVPSAEGTDFEQRYDAALQEDPHVVLAHRTVIRAATGS
jgi:hypothetical protein